MSESTKIFISIINLLSLLLGGISITLIFRLTRKNIAPYVNYYFFFLICAVVSGFCDWIIFNWVLLLVPEMSSETADIIYHIFWDLIGFPTALFAIFFLSRAINQMLQIQINRIYYQFFISVLLLITLLSYIGLYFRLQDIDYILGKSLFNIYTYIIPFSMMVYLSFAFLKSKKSKVNIFNVHNFILILFFNFLIWYFLSFFPHSVDLTWHVIIIFYYLALLLPAVYLYYNLKEFKISPENQQNEKLEEFFKTNNITEREKELVFLLLKGKSNKEISDELFISVQTVKNYVSGLYKKIGLKKRIQFVNHIRKFVE